MANRPRRHDVPVTRRDFTVSSGCRVINEDCSDGTPLPLQLTPGKMKMEAILLNYIGYNNILVIVIVVVVVVVVVVVAVAAASTVVVVGNGDGGVVAERGSGW
ncbi:hypothetical protein PV325_004465 [Microctonus aethiopoides]|nr:hypothetical protein PV325_004465 [Microctonus aethiopoides]